MLSELLNDMKAALYLKQNDLSDRPVSAAAPRSDTYYTTVFPKSFLQPQAARGWMTPERSSPAHLVHAASLKGALFCYVTKP